MENTYKCDAFRVFFNLFDAFFLSLVAAGEQAISRTDKCRRFRERCTRTFICKIRWSIQTSSPNFYGFKNLENSVWYPFAHSWKIENTGKPHISIRAYTLRQMRARPTRHRFTEWFVCRWNCLKFEQSTMELQGGSNESASLSFAAQGQRVNFGYVRPFDRRL